MIYDRVWKEIKYYALTNYIENIKSNASITKTISHWEREAKKTLAESYHDYVGKLLSNIADIFRTSARDDAQLNKRTSVLIIPAEFLTVLAFAPFERPETVGLVGVGPYFAGIVCDSVTVIVDTTLQGAFYAYNINEPEKILKLEIK